MPVVGKPQASVADLLEKLVDKTPAAPSVTVHPPSVTVHPPSVTVEAPSVTVEASKIKGWTFSVQRNSAGLIETITAVAS